MARTMTAVERIERLENSLGQFMQQAENAQQQNREATTNIIEVLAAIMKVSGEGFDKKIEEAVKAARELRAKQAADAAKAELEKLVANGVLEVTDKVGDKTVVVGREFDKEGNLLGAGRAQVEFERFVPEAQEKLRDAVVGFLYEGPGGKFEVLEIYKVLPPKAPEVVESPTASSPEVAPTKE